MIVKIEKQIFSQPIKIVDNESYDFDFIPVYTDDTHYYCYDDSANIIVDYEIVDIPTNLKRIVGIEILDMFNLPHGTE